MATLSVPVTLVPLADGKDQGVSIQDVRTDGMSTISDFQRQLAVGLARSGKLLGELKFRGNALLSDSRLHHFAAAGSDSPKFTASFTVSRDNEQLVFIKQGTGQIISLVYREDLTVAQLKRKIQRKMHLPTALERLLLGGKLLGDGKTLQASGVHPGAVLHLMLPVTGGLSSPPFHFPDVTDSTALRRSPFGPAPRWRHTTRGMNLEGKCNNAVCEAFGNMAIYPVGYCSFSLKADKAKCPCCKIQIEPLTCAFYDCWWLYDGRKATPTGPQDVTGAWQEVSSDGYYRFKETTNVVEWYSLVLSARPRAPLNGALGKTAVMPFSECTICWEALYSAPRSTTACGHTFHTGCLETWRSHMPNDGCPICRLAIQIDGITATPSSQSV